MTWPASGAPSGAPISLAPVFFADCMRESVEQKEKSISEGGQTDVRALDPSGLPSGSSLGSVDPPN